MAHSVSNVLLRGFSGKIGNQITVRQRNGKTVISTMPRKTNTRATEKQLATRLRFTMGAKYANKVKNDPELSMLYKKNQKKGKSIYEMARHDYFHPPQIVEINCNQYMGTVGDIIRVDAYDVFMVTAVSLCIINNAGEIVEKGNCRLDNAGMYWEYTASVNLSSTSDVTIKAIAFDNPGHNCEMTITI